MYVFPLPSPQNLVDTFRSVADGSLSPAGRKMFMYSGHDTTLSALLNALGMFDPPLAPPYAAAVLVELHRAGQDREGRVVDDAPGLDIILVLCSTVQCKIKLLV